MGFSVKGFSLLILFSLFVISASGSLIRPLISSFEEGYTQLFGDENMIIHRDGKSVRLSLDERTGSGFMSHDLYLHGFFSASIKLPVDYTAGVVVAFYMSNGDLFENNHDEIDFEFLGNIRGKNWRIQTNVYGNGSTNVGREERYSLWFDPSDDFHQYSILWTHSQIIFFVDSVPIREVKKTASMAGDFPSKPMSVYATIWDGSKWATNGGKYGVNYKFAPYIAQFSDFVLHGCSVDPLEQFPKCDDVGERRLITASQRGKMGNLRRKFLTYSYCYDRTRYKVAPSECVIDAGEAQRLRDSDPVTFGGNRHRHGKHHRRRNPSVRSGSQSI